MIEVIKNILPQEINKKIIQTLIHTKNWAMASDDEQAQKKLVEDLLGPPGKDNGFYLQTYNLLQGIDLPSPLNIYADIVYTLIKNNTKYKFLRPERFYWNYYNNSSHCLMHKDKLDDHYVSFVYNLHTSNGGTEIEGTFYKSNCGEAIVFPSNFLHKAITPTDTKSRFSLNCIVNLI